MTDEHYLGSIPACDPEWVPALCLKSITSYREDISRTKDIRVSPSVLETPNHHVRHRNASAVWEGSLRQGEGKLTTESGILSETPYSNTGVLSGVLGTNPDELIAASLSGCFSMALSNELALSGFPPLSIETTATATLEDVAEGWTITHMQLDVHAKVPNVTEFRFMDAALTAKANCPIARLLKTNISMTATLDL
jgi:osmotically inducible protein OsmC